MAAIALIAALTGCRASSPPAPYSRGYVRLNALIPLHPGWEDVRQIDALLRHAQTVPTHAAAPQPGAGEVRLPPALPASNLIPADLSGAEQRRISAVRAPAEKRVEGLHNTLNERTARAGKMSFRTPRRSSRGRRRTAWFRRPLPAKWRSRSASTSR